VDCTLFKKVTATANGKGIPFDEQNLEAFITLKNDLDKASQCVIKEDLSFEVETDASDYAIAVILSQVNWPLAYMSQTLNSDEQKYHAVEKEPCATVEATRIWPQFL